MQTLSWIVPGKAKRRHAALWLAVFLLLEAMEIFPALHLFIHSDAGDPDHECAVTLFTHGQVHGADAAVPILRPEPVVVFSQSRPEVLFVSTDVRLLPGRGPPSPPSLPS
jgi:hypothetical protein